MIVLRVLVERLGGDRIARQVGVTPQRQITIENLLRGSAKLAVRTATFEGLAANRDMSFAVVVAAAAANAGQAKVTTLEVTGHADRSGSDRYNLRLSQRRADAVKVALIDKGIPADQIAVIAKGESEPLVATADGVREAQNRRVQVILK